MASSRQDFPSSGNVPHGKIVILTLQTRKLWLEGFSNVSKCKKPGRVETEVGTHVRLTAGIVHGLGYLITVRGRGGGETPKRGELMFVGAFGSNKIKPLEDF